MGGGPHGQDELTRPSQKVQFNKDGGGQAARFSGKVTRRQPVTNVGSVKV
jgi:hypothetical protein